MPYRNFNPKSKGASPFVTFYASRPVSGSCSGYHLCPLGGFGLSGLMAQVSLTAIHATSATPQNLRADIKVDAFMVTGEARLINAGGRPVTICDTHYSGESKTYDPANPENPNSLDYDFDADRQPDKAVLYNGEYYVYLGGRPVETDPNTGVPINEDLRRRPDQLNDFQDRGLLDSISIDDLQQTDLYIFRVSTGELIVEREGLQPAEYVRGVGGDVNSGDGTIFYKQLIRGPRAIDAAGELLSDWWSKAGMQQELVDINRADHLRFGEQIQEYMEYVGHPLWNMLWNM